MSSLRTLSSSYSIGQLSRLFGVTPRALRFYEQIGLVEPDRDGAARVYSRGDYQRLKVIVGARRAGLKLEHIRELLDLYQPADHGVAQVKGAIVRLRERLAELEAQRELAAHSLTELEARLEQMEPSAANDHALHRGEGLSRRAH